MAARYMTIKRIAQQNIQCLFIYSLASILLKLPLPEQALVSIDFRHLEEINTDLMPWRALLNAAWPMVKKQPLLTPPPFLTQPIDIPRLKADN